MYSMFIIVLITRIIKTTCFNNTILMTKFEGKLPSTHNFPTSGYFHKIFGKHLQKGLVYLCTKMFLPPFLFFWNYNVSPNGQIISLVGAQAHLQIQLLGDEWYKVLKIIYCRVSPTE